MTITDEKTPPQQSTHETARGLSDKRLQFSQGCKSPVTLVLSEDSSRSLNARGSVVASSGRPMPTAPMKSPFITMFAVPIGQTNQQLFRYDEQRQVSQVFVGSCWVDAVTARESEPRWTRVTKVHQETTDDD